MTASRPPTAAEELRGAGPRATAARVALLDTVRQGGHLGAGALASEVRRRTGHVSPQAVYDALTGAGPVRRIPPAGGPARYEGRVGDNHRHPLCRACGVVADVDCAAGGEAPCPAASDAHGFVIDEAEVAHRGPCPGCSTSRST